MFQISLQISCCQRRKEKAPEKATRRPPKAKIARGPPTEDRNRALKAMRDKFSATWKKLTEMKRQLESTSPPPGNPWLRMAIHKDLKKKHEFHTRTLKYVKDEKSEWQGPIFSFRGIPNQSRTRTGDK